MRKSWWGTPQRVIYPSRNTVPITEEWLHLRFSVDVIPSKRYLAAYDIVGRCDRGAVGEYRPPGVLFFYFESHRERLDDLQRRIDAARSRARERYSDR